MLIDLNNRRLEAVKRGRRIDDKDEAIVKDLAAFTAFLENLVERERAFRISLRLYLKKY